MFAKLDFIHTPQSNSHNNNREIVRPLRRTQIIKARETRKIIAFITQLAF
jgi:hypothetical protein